MSCEIEMDQCVNKSSGHSGTGGIVPLASGSAWGKLEAYLLMYKNEKFCFQYVFFVPLLYCLHDIRISVKNKYC